MKREVPLFLTAVIGLFMILSFFVPHQVVSVPADFLQQCAVIVVAFGYVLGGANVVRVGLEGISRRQRDWPYKIVLVLALLFTVIVGLKEGRHWQDEHTISMFLYNQLYAPMQSTMFALLAFFIASAAFRAFRIRTFEAGLLAVAALIVMLGRVPIGNQLTGFLPEHLRLGALQDWIMNVPQSAGKRAVLIGAAMGVMATGLRVILGIERSYLGGGE
ncbi:MAG TPA: hypothetical protein VGU27_01115 [Candidatus Eisenbacteria bacterium]|nr:hypothetical protein [Candidatus Eisenbacteria bacterium]